MSTFKKLLEVKSDSGKTVRDVTMNPDGTPVNKFFADGNGMGVFDKNAIDGVYSKGWDNTIPSEGGLYNLVESNIKRNKR